MLHTPFTLLFAVQAFAAVLVPPFGLLHHHVHGHVPLMAVGFPRAQVAGAGITYEFEGALHAPFIHAAFILLHAVAVVLVPPSILLHHQVEF